MGTIKPNEALVNMTKTSSQGTGQGRRKGSAIAPHKFHVKKYVNLAKVHPLIQELAPTLFGFGYPFCMFDLKTFIIEIMGPFSS